ncbi:MAG: glycosyl hydrolase family 28-related protein, partial [Burkholderiales bacterium]
MRGSGSLARLLSRREFAMVAAFFAGGALPGPARGKLNTSSISGTGGSADLTEPALSASLANNANYNVKDYGALGDGSTNDAAAIQAAIAAAQATVSGGRVYFPPGIYYTGTKTISITNLGIVLEMADAGSYIKYNGTDYAISFALPGSAQIH